MASFNFKYVISCCGVILFHHWIHCYFQDTMFDMQFQNKGGSEGVKTSSFGGATSNMRKASSTTNIVDDLSSIFGGISLFFF